jgi:hypothetical protein
VRLLDCDACSVIVRTAGAGLCRMADVAARSRAVISTTGLLSDPYHHSRNLGEAVAVVLVCQGASKLNGIGTLLQPNDQPLLECPHVNETSGEPLAGPCGTARIAAEGDDASA